MSVAYAALLPPSAGMGVAAGDDAADARFWPLADLPPLAFDHKLIVRTSLRHLAAQRQVAARPALTEQLARAADGLEGHWRQHP